MLTPGIRFLSMLAIILLLSVSCSHRPEGVVSDKEMASVLSDMHIAEAYIEMNQSEFPDDSSRKVLLQSILQQHGMSRAELDRSLDWYGRNMDEYVKLYEDVEKELLAKDSDIRGNAEGQESVGESLFPLPSMFHIAKGDREDGIYFSFPASSVAPGSRLALRLRVTKYDGKINILFGTEYDDGSNSYTYQKKVQGGKYTIYLQTDSTVNVKRVYGSVRFPEIGAIPVWVDSLSITSEPMDVATYHQINNLRHFPASIKSGNRNDQEDAKDYNNLKRNSINAFGDTSVTVR